MERISLFDPTHMMSLADFVAIGVQTLKTDSGCSLDTKLIRMNP